MSHKNSKHLRQLKHLATAPVVSPEAMLIVKERQRQITEEGYSAAHDDRHTKGELAIAALCYARAARDNLPTIFTTWPWDKTDWKPHTSGTLYEVDRERCLVKAGALIYAEIDRLNRLGVKIVNELKALRKESPPAPATPE